MIDVLLFILFAVNFAITITLYIRFHNSQSDARIDEIRKEMSEMIAKFNKDADRNIQILEDTIQKTNESIRKYEIIKLNEKNINPPEPIPNETNKIIPVNHTPAPEKKKKPSFIIKKEDNNSEQVTKPKFNEFNPDPKPKSFIQQAYGQADNKNKPKNPPVEEEIIKPKPVDKFIKTKLPEDLDDKNIHHKIARLIGEGHSLEEISRILEMSQGEIKLLATLLKKKLVG